VYRLQIEQTPSDRARWLAEVSKALLEAQQALFDLDFPILAQDEAADLFQSIEAALIEVRSLQLSRSVRPRQMRPEWTEFTPPRCDCG
jgi:hypothetical protein